jgi:hypothetical protein
MADIIIVLSVFIGPPVVGFLVSQDGVGKSDNISCAVWQSGSFQRKTDTKDWQIKA